MNDEADEYKKWLAEGINSLTSGTFAVRERYYRDTLAQFRDRGASARQYSILETAIFEVESDLARLGRRHVDILARRARRIAFVFVPLIGLLFAGVQIKDINFVELVGALDPTLTFTLLITAYYLVMGAGFVFDIDLQKQILILDPHRGRFTRDSIIAIGFYLLTAAILFAATRNLIIFAVALAVWHFSGMYFWTVLAHQNEIRLSDSEGSAKLRHDYYALERLRLVRDYYSGGWHKPRHAILSVLVLLLGFFAIPNPVANYLADDQIAGWLGVNGATARLHAVTLIFLLYALIGEGWTWFQRVITKISLYVIDALERQYDLRKRHIGDRDDVTLFPFL